MYITISDIQPFQIDSYVRNKVKASQGD
ncbi:hypothetical protein YPPY46_1778, partial [Yersinia pestis PY-46]